MTKSYLEMMIDSLEKKVEVMTKLDEITSEQKELFEQGDDMNDEAFKSALDRKGSYIRELEKLDDGFANLFDQVKGEIGDHKEQYADEIKKLQGLIKRISELSASVEAGEKRNKQLAETYFSESRSKLKYGRQTSGMAYRYFRTMNKNENVRPQFFDTKN